MCANFTTWLDEVEAKQAELQPFETPAFLSSEVSTQRVRILLQSEERAAGWVRRDCDEIATRLREVLHPFMDNAARVLLCCC